MERRRLGRTDLPVSVLGFGGSEIGYEGASGATVARLLGQALDAGLTVVDTAECYERSEELIGAAPAAASASSSPSAATRRAGRVRTGERRPCSPASSGASSVCARITST